MLLLNHPECLRSTLRWPCRRAAPWYLMRRAASARSIHLIQTCVPSSFFLLYDLDQLDVIVSDRVRWNERWIERSAIEGRGNEELSPLSNAHPCHTFVNAGNHLIATEHKCHRLILLPAVENDSAV